MNIYISGKSRSSIADARKKRMMMAKNDVNNIIVDRQEKITYITFRFTLKSENAINERKKIFTGAFLKTLADTDVIFDYRLINDMDAGEISQLKYLFSLFPEREMLIVCGKHYGAFASDFDMDGKNKFFISMGDAELYIESRNKSVKNTSGRFTKMKLIDSHCHLEAPEFDDNIDSIIDDAVKAGIVKLITSSVTYSEWEKSKKIHERFSQVEFSIGVHPWYVSESDRDIKIKLDKASGYGSSCCRRNRA